MVPFAAGLFEFGHRERGWCWDNELPVHLAYLPSFALADRLVTNREYLEFIDDGGYLQQLLWLDNGWQAVQQHRWEAPLYWEQIDEAWQLWTLAGMRPLPLDEPVCHVSFYEADAFRVEVAPALASRSVCRARVRVGTRRAAAKGYWRASTPFWNPAACIPRPRPTHWPLAQMAGVLWQWTQSYYGPYPGFAPLPAGWPSTTASSWTTSGSCAAAPA